TAPSTAPVVARVRGVFSAADPPPPPADAARLLGYWDGPVRRRAEQGAATWRTLWDLRSALED
ncbi:hypothetical protein, partial [Kitasatospora herbaricolor]|uniref:hypothetical protein n=1 Tax=Kitasatospora herbaricolor TaxID=68217 RepID=UPI0036DE2A10